MRNLLSLKKRKTISTPEPENKQENMVTRSAKRKLEQNVSHTKHNNNNNETKRNEASPAVQETAQVQKSKSATEEAKNYSVEHATQLDCAKIALADHMYARVEPITAFSTSKATAINTNADEATSSSTSRTNKSVSKIPVLLRSPKFQVVENSVSKEKQFENDPDEAKAVSTIASKQKPIQLVTLMQTTLNECLISPAMNNSQLYQESSLSRQTSSFTAAQLKQTKKSCEIPATRRVTRSLRGALTKKHSVQLNLVDKRISDDEVPAIDTSLDLPQTGKHELTAQPAATSSNSLTAATTSIAATASPKTPTRPTIVRKKFWLINSPKSASTSSNYRPSTPKANSPSKPTAAATSASKNMAALTEILSTSSNGSNFDLPLSKVESQNKNCAEISRKTSDTFDLVSLSSEDSNNDSFQTNKENHFEASTSGFTNMSTTIDESFQKGSKKDDTSYFMDDCAHDSDDDDDEDSDAGSEISFDLAATGLEDLSCESDSNAEETENSRLLDTLCRLPIPNRHDIFRRLRNVSCPAHRDPYFFYKQNEQALQHVFDSLENGPLETDLAEDPDGLAVTLMQHQKHALAWMQFCEKRRPYGGLLADDMGLGKTLTVLSLVMAEKNRLESGEDEETWSTSYGGTLIICPASLLRQWENEVNSKFNFALMPLVFHGSVHKNDLEKLRSFDIVITTYDSVINGRLASNLLHIKWRRIVLDEAHVVRNPNTMKSISICDLKAKYRWALTGTPIQNKETDVFAILKFLRFTPFDDIAVWRSWSNDHQRLSVVLRSIMLRRTKQELQKYNAAFQLPPRTEKTIMIELSEGEMDVHSAIMSFSRQLVEKFIHQREQRRANASLGVDLYFARYRQKEEATSRDYKEFLEKLSCDASYIGNHVILVLILRLTQICCHPALAEAMLFDDQQASSTSDSSGEEDCKQEDSKDLKPFQPSGSKKLKRIKSPKVENYEEAPPCKKPKNEPLNDSTNSNDSKTEKPEPSVREILSHKNHVFNRGHPSSKMMEVMKILQQKILRTKDKAVIVSQWTGYLSILEDFLNAEGFCGIALPFNGKMSLEEREETLSQFNCAASQVKVLLLSLKCGGVGLNLTAANHLILLDLHWNPQLENQAQDRIYRLGQTKPVFIYKFLCHETIEERIKTVQEDKLKLADNLLTGATALKTGLRFSIKELKKLFGIDDNNAPKTKPKK